MLATAPKCITASGFACRGCDRALSRYRDREHRLPRRSAPARGEAVRRRTAAGRQPRPEPTPDLLDSRTGLAYDGSRQSLCTRGVAHDRRQQVCTRRTPSPSIVCGGDCPRTIRSCTANRRRRCPSQLTHDDQQSVVVSWDGGEVLGVRHPAGNQDPHPGPTAYPRQPLAPGQAAGSRDLLASTRLTLILAPAGYGKSTLLSE